jgi:hypothetical protein
MCLVVKRTDSPMLAKSDIRCHKVVCSLNGGKEWKGAFGYSDKTFPFEETAVEQGTQGTPYGDEERVYAKIEGGWFHSCEKRGSCENLAGSALEWRKLRRKGTGKIVVCNAVVPKGSLYWKDDRGYMASDRIIVYKPK